MKNAIKTIKAEMEECKIEKELSIKENIESSENYWYGKFKGLEQAVLIMEAAMEKYYNYSNIGGDCGRHDRSIIR